MTDRFHPPGAAVLANWIATEHTTRGSIFNLPVELGFRPSATDRFSLELHGHHLQTPVGVAAGPHTQLAQNIIVAWLCGARILELKTVQTLDRIDVAKPCIDMTDEGYNIEWSQELTVKESFREYLTAWMLIHALHNRFGFHGAAPGMLFDLSVGYDLKGLKEPNMRWFLSHAADAGDEFEQCREAILPFFPEIRDLQIPTRISDCVTVSTLHGCPPDEIGAIAEHLMREWGLHTAVKVNPTLVGFDTVREILVDGLGWRHIEPHRPAFDADIEFADAVDLINQLQSFGEAEGRDFGIKLCNTLPVVNRRPALASTEPTAYLSGRPLHALAVELARRLSTAMDRPLAISFAGGADAFNTPHLLAAGLRPVTSCSDLLRTGGYLRLGQYIEEIGAAVDRAGATDLDDFVRRSADEMDSLSAAGATNLHRYADTILSDPDLAKSTYRREQTKTDRELSAFDCIAAPCTDACGVSQAVPEYMRAVASGAIDEAAEIIARDNPLPTILGRACHHPCEPVCTRTHLDQPLAIREIKRFVTDHAGLRSESPHSPGSEMRVAIVGAGPCGLAAATELGRCGVQVTIFEARKQAGGMVSATIPGYRATDEVVDRDLETVNALGIRMEYGIEIGGAATIEKLFDDGFRHVIVAGGAQKGLSLGIGGEDSQGVLDGLDFLRLARNGRPGSLGRRVAVIGGGDVAMDCARSARRFSAEDVAVIYRRTVDQMPAHPEEINDLIAEGINIRELLSPRRIVVENGRMKALECAVMALGEADGSGRPRPVEIPGEFVTIELDTLIVAIGQRADLRVFGTTPVATSRSGYVEVNPETLESSVDRVYVGGDLRHPGPSNIVEACGDGRRIAHSILTRQGFAFEASTDTPFTATTDTKLLSRRSRRLPRVSIPRRDAPGDFEEKIRTLDPVTARTEASRCLDCDVFCSTCEGVCPNRALFTYRQQPWRSMLPSIAVAADGELHPGTPTENFKVGQEPQVAVFTDFCNECGNCTTFCPTSGRPWHDKPRIMTDRGDFEAEKDNAFMLVGAEGATVIRGKFAGDVHELEADAAELRYACPAFTARLNREDFSVLGIEKVGTPSAADSLSFEPCAVLWTLLRGLTESMPHLPRSTAG